jgi:hypothetical protein
VQCSTVQCSAVRCSAVQCGAVQCSAEWLGFTRREKRLGAEGRASLRGREQCYKVDLVSSAVQCSAVQCSAV